MIEQRERASYNGSIEASQASDVGSIPIARSIMKKRKRFAEIVKKTPREEGETCVAWVRRIWDQCYIYDTSCPKVLTEELLEKYSQAGAKNHINNLPAVPAHAAKSFRRVS
jgi:hypothetical protein